MAKEIKARYAGGKIEPLEELDLVEGTEVTVTINERPSGPGKDEFRRAFGGWTDLVDTDALLRDLRESRKQRSGLVDIDL